ncbi:MAG TPA: SusD/RagB family nutrient-binding outer membrane lipoprotein [Chitinophagaceae bacterium]|nr:SusD/RagB family nutrient-binding outer membrane lipoprotein [Chitinophagaceae bacterium]
MKHQLKYLLASVLLGTFIFSSCTKKIDDAYANPNAATVQPVEQIFPSLIGSIVGSSSAAGSAYGLAGDALLIGRYIQFWGTYSTTSSPVSATASNTSNYDRMGGTVGASDNLGSMWAAHYYGMGQNLNRIVEWGAEQQKWDYVGAAWALRAWSLFEAGNEYGQLILRQAFNTSLQQFTYEDQAEIYDSVRAICHRSLSYLNMTGGNMNPTNFANSDFYFNGGSLDRWKKFVYGILARSFSLLSNKTSYNADSVLIYASLSCATNADNITCKFQNTAISGTNNYFGSFRQNVNSSVTGIRQSAFIANLMSGVNTGAFTGVLDPRRWYILRENTNNTNNVSSIFKGITPWSGSSGLATADQPMTFVGTPYGTAGYLTPEQGRYIFRDAAEWPVMTASEMQFLVAEAYLRKGNNGASLAAYTNAISLNFDMLTTKYTTNIPVGREITPVDKANYLANTAIVPASAAGMTLTRIMLQKYIAMYAWGVHVVWADMRRFHYNTDIDPATLQPVYVGFVPPSSTELHASNLGKFVYRCRPRYNSEYLYNIPSLTLIGAYPPGNDYHTKECWFSKP